jgi:hypothetical protein
MRCCTASIKGNKIMLPLDIIAIEQEARRMRAIEMQRLYGQLATRLHIASRLLANRARTGLVAFGNGLHLFSSRIQHSVSHKVANGH